LIKGLEVLKLEPHQVLDVVRDSLALAFSTMNEEHLLIAVLDSVSIQLCARIAHHMPTLQLDAVSRSLVTKRATFIFH
jgi:hypothetical protein